MKEKYTKDDLMKLSASEMTAYSNLMLANEIHNLCEILKKQKK